MTEQAPFSPIALVGSLALLAAYAVAAWCVAAGIAGNARKSRRLVSSSVYALYGFTALISLTSALLIYGFVTHDFAIKYVAATSDTTMSTAYKITAFWGGLDGSLLFWVLVLALFSTVAVAMNHRRHRDMIGFVVATIMVVQVFFISLLVFTKNPFSTYLTAAPADGQGLNPLLQNYWMIIHPPSLYTGFVAATIPFAFGMAALASGRLDDMWLGSVRVWMLICFGFLSLGLILGGRWAYEELGWGGYWAWDPVENAGLIPWFTATAFLHTAIIQEQRGIMKRWNMALVIATFFLTIFGTFMTRSGIVQSVHAFGEDNVLALQFVAFLVLGLIVSVGLLVYRWNALSSKTQFESFLSREFAFLLNNWILLSCMFVVLFLTMLPTISEALDGSRMSVGIEYFNKTMTPLGLILLFLGGAAPLLAWHKTTRDRLYSQYLFPVSAMAVAIAVIAVAYPESKHLTPILADFLKLPISLVNFGVVAFVIASVAQEVWRGVAVRRRQTGGDIFTSTLGLIISKRRKYGGYVVHVGIAVMFFGFAGKAYEQMIDRTIEKPAAMAKDRKESTFKFGGYELTYERLIQTSDDNKNAVTAEVSIWQDGKKIGTTYAGKWDYHKGEGQATTEVAIHVRLAEDIYVVLTGYDVESKLANLRVYINPLILWVWVGFFIMAAGTLICLIPQFIVDWFSGAKYSRLGRAGEAAVLALIAGSALALAPAPADAAAPEHVTPGQGMGADGIGYAAMNRPTNDTEARAMKELLCVCGCPRESIFECKCSTAAQLRKSIMDFLGQVDPTGKPVFDLSTAGGRDTAYESVLQYFVKTYKGEQVLATPRTNFSWLMPVVGVVGGLGLLTVVGRRWMGGAKATAKTPEPAPGAAPDAAPAKKVDDSAYADKLDDELAGTD